MTESTEVCHIREEHVRTEGWFGTREYLRFVAETVGTSGKRIVAQSVEFQNPTLNRRFIQSRADALNQLLQQLLNGGWEVMTSNERGEVKALKRQNFQVPTSNAKTTADLLKQLASLRDAGILTEDEFESKKAEILKRV